MKSMFRTALLIWGWISLLAVVCIGLFFLYSIGPGNHKVVNKASKPDVRFVLNWCGLGDQRIEEVLKSHVSARSLTGDHLDAYAIKVTYVTVDEISNGSNDRNWYRGDSLPEILQDAITLSSGWHHEIPWFPTEEDLRSDEFYVFPCSIYCHGVDPSAAELIFVKPSENMVYYVSVEM